MKKQERFITLMNKSFDYLQVWNDILCNYIPKTNKKYQTLNRIFEESLDVHHGLEIKTSMTKNDIIMGEIQADSSKDLTNSKSESKLKAGAFDGSEINGTSYSD